MESGFLNPSTSEQQVWRGKCPLQTGPGPWACWDWPEGWGLWKALDSKWSQLAGQSPAAPGPIGCLNFGLHLPTHPHPWSRPSLARILWSPWGWSWQQMGQFTAVQFGPGRHKSGKEYWLPRDKETPPFFFLKCQTLLLPDLMERKLVESLLALSRSCFCKRKTQILLTALMGWWNGFGIRVNGLEFWAHPTLPSRDAH